MITIPSFARKQDLFVFLKKHKDEIIAAKKYSNKEADAFYYSVPLVNEKGEAIKTDSSAAEKPTTIKASVVINTTNIMDSHGDVHIPGLWAKSVKESKGFYLLQEHKMQFDKIISEKAKPSLKTMSWSELGYPEYNGFTQALIFDAEIKAERNPFMFDQYAKGYVNNHSVGMRYVNLFLCLNSTDKYDKEEKGHWDKYINDVANKEDAIEAGYFWAVTEAKIIEGSAVVRGSNYATPTISITGAGKTTPETIEPPKGTHVNYNFITNNFKL